MEKQLDTHFGLRICCIIVIWFALGGTILNSTNQTSFFSALILYLIPLTLDYNSHLPKKEKNKKRQAIGIWSTVITAAILIGMIFSGINYEGIVLNNWFQFFIWICCLFYVFLAIVDWIEYSSPEERQHREDIQRMHREKNMHEPLNKRVQYYKGTNSQVDFRKEQERNAQTNGIKTGTDKE